MAGQRPRFRPYTVMEISFAVMAFAILANAALGTLWALRQAQRPLRQSAQALLILDNTLTRLATEDGADGERALAILRAELAATASGEAETLTAYRETLPAGQTRLGLRGPRGQTLASVEVPACTAASP